MIDGWIEFGVSQTGVREITVIELELIKVATLNPNQHWKGHKDD